MYKVRNHSDLPVCLFMFTFCLADAIIAYLTLQKYILAYITEAKMKNLRLFCEKDFSVSKQHCFTFLPSFQKRKSRPTISLSNVTSSLQFTTNIWACDIWEHFKMSKVFHVALRPGPWCTIMHFDKIRGKNIGFADALKFSWPLSSLEEA